MVFSGCYRLIYIPIRPMFVLGGWDGVNTRSWLNCTGKMRLGEIHPMVIACNLECLKQRFTWDLTLAVISDCSACGSNWAILVVRHERIAARNLPQQALCSSAKLGLGHSWMAHRWYASRWPIVHQLLVNCSWSIIYLTHVSCVLTMWDPKQLQVGS